MFHQFYRWDLDLFAPQSDKFMFTKNRPTDEFFMPLQRSNNKTLYSSLKIINAMSHDQHVVSEC